ncbi:uncharacterized protein JN550_001950 [Neoarthrinium moseri]|uniref:uncharacterized protein n=1 Tax=Neoarthrinium moseri TaxID=1658444 RepID=UPI001FDCF303|nr:uncharacterized protein JN550_001950 [Neoarthrinium moseri]KAI1875664.1 hypothetical protein JN550_001950 [Neoarthrinium moseri]
MSAPGFCPDCFTGTLRGDAVLTGTVEQIHGLPVYVARPGGGVEPKGLVVIISDGFGWELKNTRALADNYAKRAELLVYLPDFMNGCAPDVRLLSAGDGLMGPSPSWFTTLVMKPYWALRLSVAIIPWLFWTRESATRPRLTKFFQDLRSNPAPFETQRLKIGVAGFCWGGNHTIFLARDEPHTRVSSSGSGETLPLVDCGFTAHPSFVTVPKDIEGIRRPISIANGPDDQFLGRENMAVLKRILEAKEDNAHEVVVYDGAKHGFAIRGDPNDPKQAELGAQAENQAVNWFKKQLH